MEHSITTGTTTATATATTIDPPPAFRRAVLAWYDAAGRTLPFRGSADPWAVLVSEVMAQQTQLARVGPAWELFMARFPHPAALAAASVGEVIRAWGGLGYNRRAVALRRCAQVLCDTYGGRVPSDVPSLERLPGIGPYTARAVVSIAFGRRVAAVDTNVRRVVGRVATGTDGSMPARTLQELADRLVPARRSADWTHALMDVGAVFCRPRRPRCEACPARKWCRYARSAAAGPVDACVPGRGRPSRPPFERSTRWLRGRIVASLRAAEDGAWVVIGGPVGSHDDRAVDHALAGLAREGLAELHPDDRHRARLPDGRPGERPPEPERPG